MAGTCYVHMGDIPAASADLEQLLEHPVIDADGDSYEDLYMLVVQEMSKLGKAHMAVPFMDRLKGEISLKLPPGVGGGQQHVRSSSI